MEAALVSSETDSEELPARIPLHIEVSFIILTFFHIPLQTSMNVIITMETAQ